MTAGALPMRPPRRWWRHWRRWGLLAWPAADGGIVAAQAIAVAVVVLYEVTELAGARWPLNAQVFAPLALFVIPMLYVTRGLEPSRARVVAAWVGLLAVLDVALVQVGWERWADAVQAAIIGTVAVCVGWRVEREMRTRRRAEEMREALRRSSARYRALFEQSHAPILVADPDGGIREMNAAALTLFDLPADTGATTGRRELADLLGPAVAQRFLAGTPPGVVTVTTGSGAACVLRPLCTTVADTGGAPVLQVLLQDITAERQQQQRVDAYAASVVHAQEEERRRIALELHDEPIQALVMLCRRLDALHTRHTLPPAAIGALETVRSQAEDIAQDLRELARGLRPPSLDDLGLVASLRQQASRFAARTSIETLFDANGDTCRLAPEVELGLFRIAQEALRNVEHHAAAGHVRVGVRFADQAVCLVVQDDGIGFTPWCPPPPGGSASAPITTGQADLRGLGLPGMRERATLLGGQLEIESAPERGTTVRATVPVTDPR